MINLDVGKFVIGSNTRIVQQVTASGPGSLCEVLVVSGVPQLH